jgi:hypothetical protein
MYRWRRGFLADDKTSLSNGQRKTDPSDCEIAELKNELADRDRVIGELTIANRILKRFATTVFIDERPSEAEQMISGSENIRLMRVPDALGVLRPR